MNVTQRIMALASVDAWSLMQNMNVSTLISDPSPSFIEAFIYGFFSPVSRVICLCVVEEDKTFQA